MITGISGFGSFWSKNGHVVTVNCVWFLGLLKPLFYSVLGLRAFWPSCQNIFFGIKKNTENFDWQLKGSFLCICCFFSFSFFFYVFCSCSFVVFFCLFVFWEEGQVRWATSLGLKASLFVLFLLIFGGFKGQVRWPKGPLHLAPNPPHYFVFVFFFFGGGVVFCFFLTNNPIFPAKKVIFVYLSVSPVVSP